VAGIGEGWAGVLRRAGTSEEIKGGKCESGTDSIRLHFLFSVGEDLDFVCSLCGFVGDAISIRITGWI
jgi:hypothetical protein